MMMLLRNILLAGLFIAIFAWAAWFTIVQFADPSLTRTQVALQTWQALIPVAMLALLVAIVEYIRTRRNG